MNNPPQNPSQNLDPLSPPGLEPDHAPGQIERPVVASYIVTFLKPEMLHVYRQITALEQFKPVVFTQKRENAQSFPFPDIRVIPKPWSHPLRRIWQKQLLGRPITIYRSEARRIRTALHQDNAKLLHVYFGHIGIHLLPLLEILDLPVVVSFHGADVQVGLDSPAARERIQRLFVLATLLLVRSESLARGLQELGCPPEKIRLHRTGIPLDAVHYHQRIIPFDGAWRCLQACRLIEKKGLRTSLRAFAKFSAEYPKATFTIAGEGPLLETLRALAEELRISHKVFFTGFLPQEKLAALMSESHLFLHPSQMGPGGDQEGVPNSMLEAMASGLPVIATPHGGIAEAIEEGSSGLLVPEGDDEALASTMLDLALDPMRYNRLSVGAHRRVTANYDLETQAKVLESIYQEAIAKAG